MSGRNARCKDRRHRRMEEARSEVISLREEIRTTNDPEQKKVLQDKLWSAMSRSTRKANQL